MAQAQNNPPGVACTAAHTQGTPRWPLDWPSSATAQSVHSFRLWGNFPQTYSMVGLINAAVRLSRSWEDAF
jgi:hypothetical protein